MTTVHFRDILKRHAKALDKELGKVKDVYFDDHSFAVRYFVIDTKKWIPGRKVLVSPDKVKLDASDDTLTVDLSSEQLRACPQLNQHKTVSQQFETILTEHYGWPAYWLGPIDPSASNYMFPGYGPVPRMHEVTPVENGFSDSLEQKRLSEFRGEDVYLRSCCELLDYDVMALDGEAGSIDDFIVSIDPWEIATFVVRGHKHNAFIEAAIPNHDVRSISWGHRTVDVRLARSYIMNMPKSA